jgi:hypothetical protein
LVEAKQEVVVVVESYWLLEWGLVVDRGRVQCSVGVVRCWSGGTEVFVLDRDSIPTVVCPTCHFGEARCRSVVVVVVGRLRSMAAVVLGMGRLGSMTRVAGECKS